MARHRKNLTTEYNKENYKMYQFRVKKTDIELIEKLDGVPNRNSYITNLISEDVHRGVLTIKEIKERIRPIIKKHRVSEVYLFGSYARGEAKRSSDIDLYCSYGDIRTLFQEMAFIAELEDVLGKDVDLVTIGSKMPDFFKKGLEEDSIRLW